MNIDPNFKAKRLELLKKVHQEIKICERKYNESNLIYDDEEDVGINFVDRNSAEWRDQNY